MLISFGSELGGNMKKHRSADAHYYKHWGEGLLTGKGGFYKKPLDSIFIGGIGSALFLTHEVCFTRDNLIPLGICPLY